MGQYTNRCEICIIIVKIKPLHIHLTTWQKSVKFMLPKWFSLPKIFCTIWLINQSYLPVTFTNMTTICKMSVKWFLFNSPVFTMRTPIIIKPCPKFFWTSCLLFMRNFARYQINCIFRSRPCVILKKYFLVIVTFCL